MAFSIYLFTAICVVVFLIAAICEEIARNRAAAQLHGNIVRQPSQGVPAVPPELSLEAKRLASLSEKCAFGKSDQEIYAITNFEQPSSAYGCQRSGNRTSREANSIARESIIEPREAILVG